MVCAAAVEPNAARAVGTRAARVHSRPVGLIITPICLDLGAIPGFCDGDFWTKIYNIFRRYGGSINNPYDVRAEREVTFQRERGWRPETWQIDWRLPSRSKVTELHGCMIGETPALRDVRVGRGVSTRPPGTLPLAAGLSPGRP